ncbi:hypothetical protein EDC04DRAFT_954440 [Pisolithus marmoratus]|nr:hypothetical protein EDC04DRAFT_954440 [Pisolithus marmoratus]
MFSNGGVAKDSITVMHAREHHEYWQSAGQNPVCRGRLRWHQHYLPHLLDIVYIASIASIAFRHYNLYVRQCYWYARITLAAMAKAFPFCSREGTTSFSRGWLSVFGSYKPSHVQLFVELHSIGCRDQHPPSSYPPPVVPAMETERHAAGLDMLGFLHGLAMSAAFEALSHGYHSLDQRPTLRTNTAATHLEEYPNLAGTWSRIR